MAIIGLHGVCTLISSDPEREYPVEAINEFLAGGGGNAGWMQYYHLATPLPVHHQSAKRRGFNLVEAAIVLGVVGLIIGGIWVAAAAVRENYQVNETITLLQSITNNANNIYKGLPVPSVLTLMTPTLISAGAIPPNYVNGTGGLTPWGTTMIVFMRVVPNKLQIYLQDMPAALCIKLAPRIFANLNTSTGTGDIGADIIYLPSGSSLNAYQNMALWTAGCIAMGKVLTGYTWIEFPFPAH